MEAIQYFLRNPKSLQVGHFKLASGKHSNVYCQCAQVLADPDIDSSLGGLMASKFKHLTIDAVVSPAIGGMIIGQSTAKFLNRIHYFMEKNKNGEFELRRSFELTPGANILIIEDVWTTSTSAMKVFNTLVNKYQCKIAGMGSIVNRMGISKQEFPATATGIPKESLIDLTEQSIIDRLPSDFGNPFQVEPDKCPLCERNIPITVPGSRVA